MKYITCCLCLALALPAEELRPNPGDWIRLEVLKTGLMRGKKHVLEFPAYSGKVDVATPAFTLSIEAGKVQVKDDWLKADDIEKVKLFTIKEMLQVEKHPLLEYRSTKVDHDGMQGTAQGMLKIRSVEKPVAVQIRKLAGNLFEGTANIDMRQFGLKPPSAALGAVGTDPILQLKFRLTMR